jgi:dTDP-4-amino-4,6-dideoxygalactose transaminase
MKVPFIDLAAQYSQIKDEVNEKLSEVLNSQHFILGAKVKELEQKIAELCECTHAIGVSSGTDALLLSLMACGIKPGDEVITTPFTFFSTASCISRLGAQPVFVDIDPRTFNINPEAVEEKLSSKTKAIIPVHLFGQLTDMDPLLDIASQAHIWIIEDAAQSIGAMYKGRKAGSIGQMGCFSFYPTKNLGAYGDGGMIVTNDEELADKLRILRVHGSRPKYYHHIIGINARLDEMQAAVLLVKLRYLQQWNDSRTRNALLYNEKLQGLPIKLPFVAESCNSIYHQYVVKAPRRDELNEHLQNNGIGTQIYYPLPLHLQPCFKYLNYRDGDFPVAEEASRTVLSLPIFAELTEEQITYIANKIREFYN